jgi:hypothetical protein
LSILNGQVAHQVKQMKMWENCIKSSMRTDDI